MKNKLLIFLVFIIALVISFKKTSTRPAVASSLPTSNVIILNDSSVNNGMIAKNGQIIRRIVATNGQNGVGGTNGTTYRSYIEWNTSSIPKNISIQSVGIYLYANTGYGSGNTLTVNKLLNPISSYPNTAIDNQRLFNDMATAPAYLKDWTTFNTVGGKVLPIGSSSSTNAITDLQNSISKGLPFGVTITGSNESSANTTWITKQDTAYPDLHPVLVIFYNGTIGQQMGMIRSLRGSFWDGTNYWQFFTSTGGQYYAYSSDGDNWRLSGKLDNDANRHLGVWFEKPNTVWVVSSRLHTGLVTNTNDLVIQKGTISGSTISWTQPVTVFATSSNINSSTIDGYDFPAIIKDSNNNCWVMTRHYYGTNASPSSGVEIKKSIDSSCSSFEPATKLIELTSLGSVHAHGGYVVPLTNGKVYAVYKDTDGTNGQIYGQLYDGNSWQPKEVIDSSSVMGIYIQGLSIVNQGDTVHLAYVASDGSIKYNSWTGHWNNAITLDNSSVFYTPSLSLDTQTGNLYVFYRNTGSNNQANASVFYKIGKTPCGASDWSPAKVVTSTAWTPKSLMIGDAFWELSSNYSSDGKIFVTYVDGIYGLKTVIIPTTP